jgi:hypothetical protein
MIALISKKVLLTLLFLAIFSESIFCQHYPISDPECDSALFCRYNHDNLIYLPHKEFTYSFRTTVEPDNFRSNGKPYPLHLFQEAIVLKMKILPECYFDQTMIKFEYLVHDSVFIEETTGLIEDKKSVWIHPPRILIAEISLSPFLEYKFDKRKWRTGALFSNRNLNISDKRTIWAKNKHSVVEDTIFRFRDEVINCKKIKIETKHRRKIIYSTMLFNEMYGFVLVDVQFINGKNYSLELIGIEPNYCLDKISGNNEKGGNEKQ